MESFKQIYPQTVIKKIKNNPDLKFWAAGFKIDKYVGVNGQQIQSSYLIPTEVKVESVFGFSSRSNEDSIDNLMVVLPNKEKLHRWQSNARGIKFFKTQEDAEKYFLFMVNKVYALTKPINLLYTSLFKKMEYISPDFLKENEIENNITRW